MSVMSRRDFDKRTKPCYTNLYFQAEKIVGSAEAPDRVSDTLLAAWRQIARFNAACDQPEFLLWLQSILSFECASFVRDQARHRETLLPSLTIFQMCDGPDAPTWEADQWLEQRTELYRRVNSATLTPRQRDCVLRWSQGERLADIGKSHGISAAAVCYIIKRVGTILAALDDPDQLTTSDVDECIRNMPAALSYQGQLQEWERHRKALCRHYCATVVGRR